MTDTLTLVSEGRRKVVGIELPKGKPDSPTRKVSFAIQGNEKFSPAGWIYADALGSIAIGDLVEYRIEKNSEGFNKLTHIAPADHNQPAQVPDSQVAPPSNGHDDAQRGGGPDRSLDSPTPAERAVPNTDTQRFESWAFVANCGMAELAFEELSDAVESGELEKISPELLKQVAGALLQAADQAQRALVGRVDRSAQSHARARGCVRTALRKYPVREWLPTALEEWADSLAKTAERLLKLAASL